MDGEVDEWTGGRWVHRLGGIIVVTKYVGGIEMAVGWRSGGPDGPSEAPVYKIGAEEAVMEAGEQQPGGGRSAWRQCGQ